MYWILLWFGLWHPSPEWGFFGHRTINRLAVSTIPAPLNQFYKRHAPYVEEHGVDPDKRRYAIPQEYKRHYIDLDVLEPDPGQPLGRDLDLEILEHIQVLGINGRGDTIRWLPDPLDIDWYRSDQMSCPVARDTILAGFSALMEEDPHAEVWEQTLGYQGVLTDSCGSKTAIFKVLFIDQFSVHGILPYWLPIMQRRLTRAFLERDVQAILRLSADIGHYIGDAHVPLHTTSNYNGQLTGQNGIHGFWESRIPELFSTDWDLITGPAEYIPDFARAAWTMVRESHDLVEGVLSLERTVRNGLSSDRIMCFEDRNTMNVLTYCPGFADAYQKAMDGMVEKRFREAIHAIGSAWYTAWVDAGQPDLWKVVDELPEAIEPDLAEPTPGKIPFGRPHDN